MKKKLLFALCIVMPYFLVASDIELDSMGEKEILEQDFDQNESEKQDASSIHDKLPTFSLTDEHRLALRNASVILAGLCTTFGNAVGRLLLIGFFTHKSFKNMRKLFNEEMHRSEHALKVIGYGLATFLLAQDGYAWLLRQDKSAIV